MNKTTQKSITPLVFFVLLLPLLSCIKKETPYQDKKFYETSMSKVYKGSVYYNQAGCANCHGISFDGKGTQAESLDVEIPSFIVRLDAKKVPLDYFLILTEDSENNEFVHTYRNYTDQGRWDMAHFLYSLALPLETRAEQNIRLNARNRADATSRYVYSNYRTWYNYLQKENKKPQK